MKPKENLGKLISEARKNKKMTQQELAELLFVSDKAVSNWETGKNIPDTDILIKAEKILETKLTNKVENKKIKYFLITIFILLFSATLIFGTYFFNNYNKTIIYKLELLNDNYYLDNAYIVTIQKESILTSGNLINKNLPYQPEYKITLYTKNDDEKEIIITKNNYTSLSNIKLDEKTIKNLYLDIEYLNYNNLKQTETIKLELKEQYRNNKLFYKNKKEEKTYNEKTIILLMNNGYNKIDNDIYEKKKDNELYRFNLVDNSLYYEGTNEGITYYGKVSKNQGTNYVIVKNNEIISFNIDSSNKKSEHSKYILEKLQEFERIIND